MSMSKPPEHTVARRWWRRRTGRIWMAMAVAVVIGGITTDPPPDSTANAPVPGTTAAAITSRAAFSNATTTIARTSAAAGTPVARRSAPVVTTRSRTAVPPPTFTAFDGPRSTSAPMPAATPVPTPAQKSTPAPSTRARPGTALAAAATLTVRGRGPMTGYSRDQFGQAWADTDRNGCDQRNDVLRRDLSQMTIKADTHGCAVLTGVLHDPYTGATISFTRGVTTSSAVQIDHVVAEGNAWVTGAAPWTPATREQFANDPLDLLAISGPANEQKGDGDAATWLPANKSYRCQYVARQIAVKCRYHLTVTAAELAAIRTVLATCPRQALPVAAVIPLNTTDIADPTPPPITRPTRPVRPIPAIPTTTAPPTPTPVPAQDDVYYQNCAAVRAAGRAPLHTGDPGYSRKLDRDHDGTACEN